MQPSVLALVLAAALIDSLQHVLIKSGTDPYRRSLCIAMAGGLMAVPMLFVTGLPDPAVWPILAVSVMFGSLYWFALGWAYAHATLAAAFPLSRGAGIVLTALGGWLILGENLAPGQMSMMVLILAGLGFIVLGQRPFGRNTVLPSLCLAVVIAGYTLLDAIGVRLAGSPLAYCCALYVGNGLVIGALSLPRMGLRAAAQDLPNVVLAAVMSFLVYAMVLYALAHGPVAVVSALAETSILFSALIGILWLREGFTPRHAMGLGLIALGVILLRLDPWTFLI